MKIELGRNWYQSIHFDKLSFFDSKWTSRKEHKRFKRFRAGKGHWRR
jgi:hypothetical protein